MTPAVMIATIAVLVVVAASILAHLRFPDADRLPMNWGLQGKPTWFAPRGVALAFTPALTILLVLIFSTWRAEAPGTLVFVSLACVAAHFVHLWLIRRHLG